MNVSAFTALGLSQRHVVVSCPPGRSPCGVPLETQVAGGARVDDVDAITAVTITAIGPTPHIISSFTPASTLHTTIGNASPGIITNTAIHTITSPRSLSPSTLIALVSATVVPMPNARTLSVINHRATNIAIGSTAAITTIMAATTSIPTMFIGSRWLFGPGALASVGVRPRRGARPVASGVIGGDNGGGIRFAAAAGAPCCVAAVSSLRCSPAPPPAFARVLIIDDSYIGMKMGIILSSLLPLPATMMISRSSDGRDGLSGIPH